MGFFIEGDNGDGNLNVEGTNLAFFGHNVTMKPTLAKRIVVVKNRGMGDSIMGLSTISYMRTLFPDAFIAYAVPAWICPLYDRVGTDADQIWPLRLAGVSDWLKNWNWFARVDLIYEMFQSGRTGTFFKWYQRFHGCTYLYHNHHLKEGPVFRQGNVRLPAIQRDLDGAWTFFAKSKGFSLPDHLNIPPRLKLLGPKLTRKNIIILGVVATVDTKMWSLENYYFLVRKIYSTFPKWKIEIPIPPSDVDMEKVLSAKNFPPNVELIKKDLSSLPALFAQAKLYIGNDTGIKHLAVAMGVKTYTMFGPIPPDEFHPYDHKKHPYFFINGLECRTVNAHFCGLSFCEHKSCLEKISVQEVFDRVKGDLKGE